MHWPWGVLKKASPIGIVASNNEVLRILKDVSNNPSESMMVAYLLRGMDIQFTQVLENLNLPLGRQVLVAEEDDAALVDEGSKFIELLVIQLAQLNILQLRA